MSRRAGETAQPVIGRIDATGAAGPVNRDEYAMSIGNLGQPLDQRVCSQVSDEGRLEEWAALRRGAQ